MAKASGWGGSRPGAGRKPKGERAGVSHAARPILKRRSPVEVTVRLPSGFENLRSPALLRALKDAFVAGSEYPGFRVVHFALQPNELRLIVEADGTGELSGGMQGLTIRMAHAINRVKNRRGRVFTDRFDARVLSTAAEARQALASVVGRGDADAPVAAPRTRLLAALA